MALGGVVAGECGAAASLWRGESRRNRRRATCNTYVLRCNGRLWRPAGAGRRPAGHRRRPSPLAHAAEEVCQLEVTGAHEMHPLHRHLTCHCLDLTCFYVWGNGLQRGSEPQSSGARLCPGDARNTRTVLYRFLRLVCEVLVSVLCVSRLPPVSLNRFPPVSFYRLPVRTATARPRARRAPPYTEATPLDA